MGRRYAIIGAGRIGIAAAYDLAINGNADEVSFIDQNVQMASDAAERLNRLLDRDVGQMVKIDVEDITKLRGVLRGVDAIVSAVPYHLNMTVQRAAIDVGAHMSDLGGNTGIVRAQLAQSGEAKDAGVTIVPDCGMGPGMNVSLAMLSTTHVEKPEIVQIWDGGLPQDPVPPWNYELTFNVGGLTNEYYGSATFLKDGKVTNVPALSGYEVVDILPLGELEAFVTSGGLSTMPWTMEGRLQRLENRTLRYLGHHERMVAYEQLGMLELEPVEVGDLEIVPRDVFHSLLEPRVTRPDTRDICLIKVFCQGKSSEATITLVDRYDEATGFTAMQRLTGWHASLVALMAVDGRIDRGAVSVENVDPEGVLKEARDRGFQIDIVVEDT